jgi:DNA invertase Pin-like site-specific DNA recombinase
MDTGTRFIAYYRVSTKRQGQSGLGLEGQRDAVERFVQASGGTLLPREFIEVESGKNCDRPKLNEAIACARGGRAVLLVAKLDRLSRNVGFLCKLMDEKIPFKACDNPYADEFTVHILSAVAQKEAKDISSRTKSALLAYKRRGGMLGAQLPQCRDNMPEASRVEGRKLGAVANRENAIAFYADSALPEVSKLRGEGMTLQQIADAMNAEGVVSTRSGKPWNPMQVSRVLKMVAMANA